MSHIGRNDPCHCGSGKKYKKCCLATDQQKERDEYLLSKEYLPDDDLFEEVFGEYDKFDLNSLDFGALNESFEDDYPKISTEEEIKVNDWWERYKEMDDPEEIILHLKTFLEENTIETNINLGLEHEVIFELVAESQRRDSLDKAIDFLFYMRERYPDIYVKSAGYYDTDIIVWLCLKGRTAEISQYLNYFEEFPVRWIEKLFKAIDFLLAIGLDAPLVTFTKKIYKELWYSKDVMNGESIADIPFNELVAPFLSGSGSDDDIKSLTGKLAAMELDFHKEIYTTAYWQQIIEEYHRPFEVWDVKSLGKRELINRIFNNYMRYLIENKSLSIHVSHYYTNLLKEFYVLWFTQKRDKNNLFKITEKQINSIVAEMGSDFIHPKVVTIMSAINSLSMYAEYLEVCGNYTEEDKKNLIQVCSRIHKEFYDSFKPVDMEILAFERFPMY
ncbi:YecA family protein [Alkalitalea saponilacus]|uniref:SEC-C motif-containing protein n=1 Tax=Alkalitalea saponilacus TaxID=889453 RepID=A0A1T5GPD3_9BACT|nr:SEC-C metal-binding domain-containing protein [Alkalitalea saponilacus]SKC10263.1 SEC-C motif-containing protein [Alkalitalea saponilacus]